MKWRLNPLWRTYTLCQLTIGIVALVAWFAPLPRLKPSFPSRAAPPLLINLPYQIAAPEMVDVENRPLFVESRHPRLTAARPQPPTPIAEPSPTTQGIALLGILHTATHAIALVMVSGNPQPEEVTVGSMLGEWVITKIADDRLVLRSGKTSTELVLPRPNKSLGTGINQPTTY